MTASSDENKQAIHEALEQERKERELAQARKRNLIVQYVVVLVTVGLVIGSTLITVGAVKEENERQTIEIDNQKRLNVTLFKNDAELREIVANQRIILTELSVNLQTLMETRGLKYKRAQ